MSMWKSALLAVCLAGCTPFRYYPMPVSSGEARATFAPLATAASNMGYQYWRWNDSVGVQLDPMTRLSYMFDASNHYVLCVELKSKVPKGGIEAALAAGKRAGDEIWRRAMALRPTAPVQIMVPAPSSAAEPEPEPQAVQEIVTH